MKATAQAVVESKRKSQATLRQRTAMKADPPQANPSNSAPAQPNPAQQPNQDAKQSTSTLSDGLSEQGVM